MLAVLLWAVGAQTMADYHRVQVFDLDGAYLRKWGTYGSGPGQFKRPVGIGVNGGEVFVAEEDNDRVQVFDTQGNYLRAWSIPSGPNRARRYLDFDPSGNVLLLAGDYYNVLKYSREGDLLATLPTGIASPVTGIAASSTAYFLSFLPGWRYFGYVTKYNFAGQKMGTLLITWGTNYVWDCAVTSPPDDRVFVVYDAWSDPNPRIASFYATHFSWGPDWWVGQTDLPSGFRRGISTTHSAIYSSHQWRILVNDLEGTPIRIWGEQGSGNGQMRYVPGLWADEEGGALYVTDWNVGEPQPEPGPADPRGRGRGMLANAHDDVFGFYHLLTEHGYAVSAQRAYAPSMALTNPVVIAGATPAAIKPGIVVLPDGRLRAVYESTTSAVATVHSSDNGRTWE